MAKKTIDDLMTSDVSLETLATKVGPLTQFDEKKLRELSELQAQMGDFLIERFQNNIAAFEQYMPNIANTFRDYRPKKTLDFFCTDNGIPNLILTEKNEFFYKTFDPFALCKAQVDAILSKASLLQTSYTKEWDPYGQIHFKYLRAAVEVEQSFQKEGDLTPKEIGSIPNCIMLGVGLGYQLAYLYEQVEIANMVIVEPDLDIFFASLHAFDWASLLKFLFDNKYGIHLMLGQTPKDFFIDMEKYYAHHGRFISGSWLGYVHYSSERIRTLGKILLDDFAAIHAAMGFFDDHLFGCSHACRAILDRKSFVKQKPEMLDKFKKLPVFIVGSGPSLDHDIQFLRKNQDKAIIIACGTAIDTLYHAGIKPDIYACTERTPEISDALSVIPDKHFFDDIILMCGDVIHPYTTKLFKHTAIFAKYDEPFARFAGANLRDYSQVKPVQLMTPLVGNMGVSGACYLGLENLYLFGLDNGSRVEDQEMHSKYTTLYNCHNNGVSKKSGSYATPDVVEANFGGTCKTGYFFKLSARNIGFIIGTLQNEGQDIHCYNCSDGVKIKSTVPMHSEDLAKDFDKLPALNKKEFFDFMVNEKTMPLTETTMEHLKALFSEKAFNSIVDKILDQLNNAKINNRTDGIQLLESVSEYLTFLEQNAVTYFMGDCLEGSLQTYFIVATKALYKVRDEKVCIEHFLKILEVIKDFLEETKSLFKYLPDYVIYEHRKYHTNGKVGVDYPTAKAPDFPPRRKIIYKEYDDPQKVFEKKYK